MANFFSDFYNKFFKSEYYKTAPLGVNMSQLTGTPEFITITNSNAYNVMKTTSELDAIIGRRGLMLATGKWVHEKSDSKGNIIKVENSEFVRILENPNVLMNGNDHLIQWHENMALYGANYEYMLKPYADTYPESLNNLQVNNVEMKVSGKFYKQSKIEDIILYYNINTGTEIDRVDSIDINYTRLVNSNNPLVGESPLKALYMDISNIRGAKKFRNVIMTKEGALGILSNRTKDAVGAVNVDDEDRNRIDNAYTSGYGLEDGKKKVIMTNADLKWEAMAFPTNKMMLFEEVDAGTSKILDQFGMDENIFSTASTYENKVQALRTTYQSTVIPISEEVSMNRTRIFGLDGRTEWLRLDYSHIPVLQENLKETADVKKTKSDAVSTLVGSGMTLPEAILTTNLND